jgi:hypothetical protein
MINANELRIGNWIFNEMIGKNKQVDGDLLYAIDGLKNGVEQEYYYIPLTPEILEKAGYKKNKTTGNYLNELSNDDGIFDAMLIEEDKDWFTFVVNANSYDNYTVEIKYLHQLQNLYFALTGEELTVNFNSTIPASSF